MKLFLIFPTHIWCYELDSQHDENNYENNIVEIL